MRWLKDEAPRLEEWLVYPAYLEVAAELDARHFPGVYVHGSKIVVKGRDPNGKLRSMKVPDISFVESAAIRRLLATIYNRVRQEQIVVTGGRYLTEEQFMALSEATYKALTAAGTSSRLKGRQSAVSRAGRKASPSTAVEEKTDRG